MNFEDIFDKYFDKVYKFINMKTLNHMDAEDIALLVFEKVHANLDTYSSSKSSFETWLFSIVRNEIASFYRKKQIQTVSMDATGPLVDTDQSPEKIVEMTDINSDLKLALAKLSDKERTIIAYKYGADMKNTDIGDLLGISSANVGVVLFRALKKLKRNSKKTIFSRDIQIKKHRIGGIIMNKKDIDRSNDLDINLGPNQEREIDNILEGPDQNVESLHDLKFEDELKERLNLEFSPSQASKNRIRVRLLESNSEDNLLGGPSESPVDDIKGGNIMANKIDKVRNTDNAGKKKTRPWSRKLIAASIAGLLIVAGIGIPVIGNEFFTTTKTLKTDNGNIIIHEEKPLIDLGKLIYHFPENLKGKIYDAQGRQVDDISYKEAKNTGVFDKDGNKIKEIDEKNGTYILEKDADKVIDEGIAKFKTLEEAQKYLAFKPKLPAGCKLIEVGIYKDENGLPGKDIADFILEKDGAKIYMQERLARDGNRYETSTDDAKYVYLNSKKAIMSNNKSIDWEDDGLLINISSKTSTFFGQSFVDLAKTVK